MNNVFIQGNVTVPVIDIKAGEKRRSNLISMFPYEPDNVGKHFLNLNESIRVLFVLEVLHELVGISK